MKPSAVQAINSPTTSTSSTIPTSRLSGDLRITSASELAPPTDCQIPSLSLQREDRYLAESAGFPRPASPETFQSAKILVIPVSTADFLFSDEDLTYVEDAVSKAIDYWTSVSYGQASLEFSVLPREEWPILAQSSSELGFPRGSNTTDFADFANDVLDVVRSSFDVSPFDNLFFALPVQPPFEAGQALKIENSVIAKSGAEQTGLLIGGVFLPFWEIIAHELGHSWLRLEDLYRYDTFEKFMGVWDIMGGAYNAGKELTAWSRWLSGWVSDEQVRCLDSTGDSVHFIEAIEIGSTLPKATVVRVSETTVLVIESRRNMGYDTAGPATIIYTVDSENSTMEGIYRLEATLTSVGQSETADSITVTLLDSDEWGDLVQVTRDS